MGWNAGFKIIEQQVINLYNINRLDEDTLEAVISPFRGTDVDSGGSRNLTTHDGKSFEDIVIEIMAPAELREKYFTMKQKFIEQKSEIAVMNYWSDVMDQFPNEEAFKEANKTHDEFQDIKYIAFSKATGW